MHYSRIPAFLLALMVLFETAGAQTGYSLRISTFSTHLAGIVDDPLTDAYLNPARLSRFEHMQVYGAWLPRIFVISPFPVSTTNDLQFGPIEDHRDSFGFDPLAFSFIKTIHDGIIFSAGMQVSVNGNDFSTASPTYDLDEWGNQLSLEQRLSVRDQANDGKFLRFDLAAAGIGMKSLGLRLTAEYNSYRDNHIVSTSYNYLDLSNLTDTAINERYTYDFEKYEATDISLLMGVWRSDDRLSDVSVGGAVCRRLCSAKNRNLIVEDTDSDRNGERIGGGSPYLRIIEDRYETERDYLGLRLFGRAHWNVREHIRAVHSIAWHRSWGDGRAEFASDDLYYSASRDIDSRSGGYAYDGILSNLYVTTATGYSKEIHEGFVAMFGVKGVYSQLDFEEDGEGSAGIFLDQSNGSYDSLSSSSSYVQKHDRDQTEYTFVIPVGCEWRVHDYINLRIGIEITAYHSSSTDGFRKSVPAIELPPEFEMRGTNISHSTDYETHARFNNGIEVNIRDRLILEFLAFSSHYSSIRLADYGYVSVRYLF